MNITSLLTSLGTYFSIISAILLVCALFVLAFHPSFSFIQVRLSSTSMESTQATTEETQDTHSQPQQHIKTVEEGVKPDMPGRGSHLGDVYQLECHFLS